MRSCVVKACVFLFSVTQVACTALRSRSTARCLPTSVEVFVEMSDAELMDETDEVGVVVPDAANAAVPAPPMMTAVAPTAVILFHMMCSLVHCAGEWSYVDNLGAPGCLHSQGIVRICLLYTSPSPRDRTRSRMPSS